MRTRIHKTKDEIKEWIENRVAFEPSSGCWLWEKSINYSGYGVCHDPRTDRPISTVRVHRLSFEIYKEPVPDGLVVCHRCDIRSCVNPDHLFAATQKDNIVDALIKGRSPIGHKSKRSKLTLDEASRILKIREDGKTYKEIAEMTGMSKSGVQHLCTGRSWRIALMDQRGQKCARD